MNPRDYWQELAIIGTVLLLIATIGFVIYEDRQPPPDRTYTQYDLVFGDDDTIDELLVVPPDQECTVDHSIVAAVDDHVVKLETGTGTERQSIDDLLETHEFTFCLNDDQQTAHVRIHEYEDGQLAMELAGNTITVVDREIDYAVVE